MNLLSRTFTIAISFLIIYSVSPFGANASTAWEKDELIGSLLRFDSDTRVETFFFMNERNVSCTIGNEGNKGPVAPCLGFWNMDSSGTVTVTDCCEGKITMFKVRSRGTTIEGFSIVRTIDVMSGGVVRVYKHSKHLPYMVLLVGPLVIVGLVWVIIRWHRNRVKRILNVKETSASS